MAPKKPAKRTAKTPAAKKKAASAKPKASAKAGAKKASAKAKSSRTAKTQAKKPAAKAKPKAARKPAKTRAKPPAKPRRRKPVAVAIGDEITFPAPTRLPGAQAREQLAGIVCSIREIRTGMPVKKTKGDLMQYVLEVLDSRTFASEMSSAANSDTSAARRRVQAYLRKSSQGKRIPTLAGGALAETGLGALDGWRIVKVRSAEVEPVAPAPAPRKKR